MLCSELLEVPFCECAVCNKALVCQGSGFRVDGFPPAVGGFKATPVSGSWNILQSEHINGQLYPTQGELLSTNFKRPPASCTS